MNILIASFYFLFLTLIESHVINHMNITSGENVNRSENQKFSEIHHADDTIANLYGL